MKHVLLALLSGILLALGWPTYGFPLLLFFAFIPLLLLEHRFREHRYHKSTIFGLTFLGLFVWNLITTGWLFNLPTAFAAWFALIANTILMTLVFLLYHIVAKRVTFTLSTIFFACLWMSFEYMHLQWEFSWPWLTLGNGFSNFPSWIQWYEYTGAFGGTLWVLIVNLGLFKGLLLFLEHKEKAILYRSAIKNGMIIIIPIIISFIILKTYEEKGQEINVLILQPNINPYTEKYNTTDTRIGKLIQSLAKPNMTSETDFVIAPETVFADGTSVNRFASSHAKRNASLILKDFPNANFLGGISMGYRFRDSTKIHKQTNILAPNDFYDDYNSAFFVRPDGTNELYHKTKLVVGVENFPYQNLLKPILGDVMLDLGGTVAKKTTQDDREVFFNKDRIGVGPIICYESVYGEFVTGYIRNKADFLAIITNDAWWGNSQGHQQHMAYARLRAIETRRSIARSANTGISAIINQTGQVVSSLAYEKKGVVKGTLRTNDKITFYVKAGNYIPRVASFLTLFIFLFSVTRRKKS